MASKQGSCRWQVYRGDGQQVVAEAVDPQLAECAARRIAAAWHHEGHRVRVGPLAPRRRWMRWDELVDLLPEA